ncbi:MAG: hypothetical protein ACYTKD_25215 [Planctomycetota bacterium]
MTTTELASHTPALPSAFRLRTTVSSISEPVSSGGRTWVALGCSNGLAYLMKLVLPAE